MRMIVGQYNIKSPEHFLNLSYDKQKEIEIYLDKVAGKDEFLDNVAYYFDAKSHGFKEINGVKIHVFRKKIEKEILRCKVEYQIK